MKTSTLIIGGVVVAGGFYILGQKLAPQATQRSPVETIVDGAKSIVGMLTGGKTDATQQQAGNSGQTWGQVLTGWLPGMGLKSPPPPPSVPKQFGGGPTGTGLAFGPSTGYALVGDGDAAISDALDQDRTNKNLITPNDAFTSEDRIIGVGPSASLYLPRVMALYS